MRNYMILSIFFTISYIIFIQHKSEAGQQPSSHSEGAGKNFQLPRLSFGKHGLLAQPKALLQIIQSKNHNYRQQLS